MKKIFSANIWSLLMALAVSTMMFSCNNDDDEDSTPDPTASFTVSPSSAEVGENVSFTNTSENAETYMWDFGDGNTSTDENPMHSYAQAGSFTITLTAMNGAKEASATQEITVEAASPDPVANFEAMPNPSEPGQEVTFTNLSENATSFEWDFGDGNTSTEESPVHIFEEAGNFRVRLTVRNDAGAEATIQKQVTVAAKRLVAIPLGIRINEYTPLTDGTMPVLNGLTFIYDNAELDGDAVWSPNFYYTIETLPAALPYEERDNSDAVVNEPLEWETLEAPLFFYIGHYNIEDEENPVIERVGLFEVNLSEYSEDRVEEIALPEGPNGLNCTLVVAWEER